MADPRLSEIQEGRKELEVALTKLVNDYYHKYGILVTELNLYGPRTLGENPTKRYVTANLAIPYMRAFDKPRPTDLDGDADS